MADIQLYIYDNPKIRKKFDVKLLQKGKEHVCANGHLNYSNRK